MKTKIISDIIASNPKIAFIIGVYPIYRINSLSFEVFYMTGSYLLILVVILVDLLYLGGFLSIER